jgi:hypothetical protein
MRRLALAGLLLTACAGNSPDCVGLDETTCYQTSGCAVNSCPGCDCAPGFAGCRRESDPPVECPAPSLICPGTPTCCRDDSYCNAASCLIADPNWCGVPCQQTTSTCSLDTDCDPGSICAPAPCCTTVYACEPGCTSADQCANAGEDCVAGRCVPHHCSAGAACPPNTECAAGGCVPRACTTDLDCDKPVGVCVLGLCQDHLGMCYAPVP